MDVDDAAKLARTMLAEALPRRWRHVRSVARRARWVAKQLSLSDDLVAAAWLHGCAAYAWVTTPDGERKRKWVYGKTHDEVHDKWIKLLTRASQGPVQTITPTVARYLAYWLREIVEPNLAPKTYDYYEMFSRLYIAPGLGAKRLDRLQVRDVRSWLNRLRQACQCCMQGKDATRPLGRQRCCAIGKCCDQRLSERTIKDARDTLRAALANAVAEELLTRNVATIVRLPAPRKRKRHSWSVEEARTFLESARNNRDPALCRLRPGPGSRPAPR
jgi:hypothetical protein